MSPKLIKVYLAFIGFLFLGSDVIAQQELIGDINYTYDKIKSHHPKFRNEIDSIRITRVKDSIINSLKNGERTTHPNVAIGLLLSAINDGHTGLSAGSNNYFLPFELHYNGKHYLVEKSFVNEFQDGDIVLKYNDTPLDDVYKFSKMFECSVDNNYDFVHNRRNAAFLNQYNRIGNNYNKDSIIVSILRNEEALEVKTKFYKRGTLNVVKTEQTEAYLLQDTIWYLKVHSFAKEMDYLKLRKLIEQMKTSETKKLVLDLRGNNGGLTYNLAALLSLLLYSPGYSCIDSLAINNDSYTLLSNSINDKCVKKALSVKDKKTDNIKCSLFNTHAELYSFGRSLKLNPKDIIVLIDEGTYSAGAICAASLQDMGSIVLGAPSMASNNFVYAFRQEQFKTPKLGIGFKLPLLLGIRNIKMVENMNDNLMPNRIVEKKEIIAKALEYLNE